MPDSTEAEQSLAADGAIAFFSSNSFLQPKCCSRAAAEGQRSALPMIPTTFKSKIPQTHSYPVGAELLSEALASVPQLDMLKLQFYGLWTSSDERNLQRVLNVNHINIRENRYSSKNLVTQGFYDETWEIIVYPVLRGQKAEVKRLLLVEGLPKVQAWLSAKRTRTWLEGRRALSLLFAEGSPSLIYEEGGNM